MKWKGKIDFECTPQLNGVDLATVSGLHDQSHAITSTSDHTAGAWKVIYTDASGDVQELALGADGDSLVSNGPSAAPSWTTISGGAGAGDVTSSGTLVDHSIIRGDAGAKQIQDSYVSSNINWIINDNGQMDGFTDVDGDYALYVRNASTAGNGIFVNAGESLGDIVLHLNDSDDSFGGTGGAILQVEADQGHITMFKSYAQTLSDRGIVYGFDNQGSGVAKDFNTQFGVYRIGGEPCAMNTYFEDAESDGESSTTSTTYVVKLTHTTPTLPAGRYRIGYSCELAQAATGSLSYAEIKIGSDVLAEPSMESDGDYHSVGGFAYRDLTNAAHTVVISHKTALGTNASLIRRARIEIWRVS